MAKPIRSIVAVCLALFFGAFATGCASLAHGTHQSIGVDSVPSGARIFVNGDFKGLTPAVLDLKRDVTQKIKVDMTGYQPYETVLRKTMSGWMWATAVIGGIGGLAVDTVDGALYNLTPERIEAHLFKAKPAAPKMVIDTGKSIDNPSLREPKGVPTPDEIRRVGPAVETDGFRSSTNIGNRLDHFVGGLPDATGAGRPARASGD